MVNDNIAATRAGEPTRDDAPFAKFPISSVGLCFVLSLCLCLSLSLSLAPAFGPTFDGDKKPLVFEDESLNS
jgi:hypothetical protein